MERLEKCSRCKWRFEGAWDVDANGPVLTCHGTFPTAAGWPSVKLYDWCGGFVFDTTLGSKKPVEVGPIRVVVTNWPPSVENSEQTKIRVRKEEAKAEWESARRQREFEKQNRNWNRQ